MKRCFLFIGFLIVILSSCRTTVQEQENKTKNSVIPSSSIEKIEKAETIERIEIPEKIISLEEFRNSDFDFKRMTEMQQNSLIDSLIENMSDHEKIGQLFMLAVRHTSYGQPAYEADAYVQAFMDRYLPGGIILFSINFKNPDQTRKMILDLQQNSPYPLFITTDEEGGRVSRLGNSPEMDVISLPTASILGEYASPRQTELAASVLAADMRDLGFNMNMAPVADLRTRGEYDVIGNRSFSSDHEINALQTAAFVKGLQDKGISSVLKHFPGHGNVNGDSHNGAVKSLSSRSDFMEREFASFRSGIAAGADFVLTAHIAAPSLSGDLIPASMSSVIQTEILRKQLKFDGLIITDAMDMGAVKTLYTPGEAAINSILAGTDIILMPEHIPSAQSSIREALIDGRLSEERLNSSLIRILRLKFEKGMFNKNYSYIKKLSISDKTKSHRAIRTQLKTE